MARGGGLSPLREREQAAESGDTPMLGGQDAQSHSSDPFVIKIYTSPPQLFQKIRDVFQVSPETQKQQRRRILCRLTAGFPSWPGTSGDGDSF